MEGGPFLIRLMRVNSMPIQEIQLILFDGAIDIEGDVALMIIPIQLLLMDPSYGGRLGFVW